MPSLLEPKSEYLIKSGSAGIDAKRTERAVRENASHMAESAYLSPFFSCYEMLFDIAQGCSELGWDGYGATPISGEVYFQVATLINNFPVGLSAPELVPENDGAITFEWHNNYKQEISISINPNNVMYYAFVDGSEKKNGAYVFQESLPPFLIHMINQVMDA